MYRCTECNAEYNIKPDYCDCGNDTFEEILPQKQEVKKEIPQEKIQINKTETKEFYKTQKTIKKSKPFFDPISTIIFSVCVILSFIIVFFVGNPKEQPQVVQKKEPVKTAVNIPDINKFWNNAVPKVEQQPQNQVQQPINQPIQVVQEVKPQPVIIPQKQKVQQRVKPVQKQVQPQKPVAKQPQKTYTQPQQRVVQNTKPQQVQQSVSQKPQQQIQTPPPQPQTITVNKQELTNYKVGLRNKIAHQMNLANVIGDGTCSVSFKVSTSGMLKDKKFSRQSDNFTLNQVVHSAVMQISSYNPPPIGYKETTMILTVKIKNGNYEVSLY